MSPSQIYITKLHLLLQWEWSIEHLWAVNVQTLSSSGIIGVIEGGYYVDERLRSADETAKRPVAGVLPSLLLGFIDDWVSKKTRKQRESSRLHK